MQSPDANGKRSRWGRQYYLPVSPHGEPVVVSQYFEQGIFRRPSVAKLYLRFEQNDQVLKEVSLTQAATTIGRLPDNSVQIDNLAVSGHHAKISWDQDHY